MHSAPASPLIPCLPTLPLPLPRLREYVAQHLPALAAAGVDVGPDPLGGTGWTVGAFDDAVTLRQLGYDDAPSCERLETGRL